MKSDVSTGTTLTNILIVEDNKIDARLTSHAIKKISDWPSTIQVVDDGEKALRFLRRELAFVDAARPDLIILDLNLPKYDGIEILQSIRSTEDLRNLTVFIFSSSPADVAEDRMLRAKVQADGYFEKPNEVGTYSSIVAKIREHYYRARLARQSTSA